MKLKIILLILFILKAVLSNAQTIEIDSPSGGFTTDRVVGIKGRITGFDRDRCTLVINGIPQTIPLENGGFNLSSVPAPGLNVIEIQAGGANRSVSFYANVPQKDIKVLLTWDTPTDIDLWVTDPYGNKCYYANRSTPLGGNLDTDVTAGYGPETFTMARAMPGTYSVQVQYYDSADNPVTRVKVYVILFEGQSRAKREAFEFAMTREHAVYHINDFTIEEE